MRTIYSTRYRTRTREAHLYKTASSKKQWGEELRVGCQDRHQWIKGNFPRPSGIMRSNEGQAMRRLRETAKQKVELPQLMSHQCTKNKPERRKLKQQQSYAYSFIQRY